MKNKFAKSERRSYPALANVIQECGLETKE